jgi:hypothetical protein
VKFQLVCYVTTLRLQTGTTADTSDSEFLLLAGTCHGVKLVQIKLFGVLFQVVSRSSSGSFYVTECVNKAMYSEPEVMVETCCPDVTPVSQSNNSVIVNKLV